MIFLKRNFAKAAIGVAMLCAFAIPAQAQEVKIGVVDLAQLLEYAPQTRAMMEGLQEEFAPRQREFTAKAQELEDLTARIQQDAAVMGESERNEAERQFRDLQREVARLQNDLQEDWNLRQNEELGSLQRSVITQVRAYAEAEGYDLVVGEGIVFASTAVNITEEVLRAIEADYQANNAQ